MTDGGYTLDEARSLQNFPETTPRKTCPEATGYDGVKPPACFPVCESCLAKWLNSQQ